MATGIQNGNSTGHPVKDQNQTLVQRAASCSNTPMRKSGFTTSGKWRQHFTIDRPQAKPGCIWVHACSVGEVASVTPLIRALLEQGHRIHLTVVTATGFAHADRLLGNSISLSFLPWDLPTTMRRLVRALQPALLLLAETEFWPGMLSACKKQDIPVIGINTRISDRSFPRYRASRRLWKRWLAPVCLFLPQSQTDAERLIAMGVKSEKIEVAGNLKYAIKIPDVDSGALRKTLDNSSSRPILIIASTHAGEDSLLLDMWPAWHSICPDLLTIIVPRHPERFDQVAELLQERGHSLSRWSELHDRDTDGSHALPHHVNFVLLDGMGILTGLYTIADLVIVGGSLIDIGGHNPLEAAICGRGVVTGPHVQNFRDIMADMQQAEAAIISRNPSDMDAAIIRLLSHPDELRHLNASAALFMQDRSRILDRMLAAIEPWMAGHRNHHVPSA
ncbi:MAG: 3-deoxy-D-manno-octulosonic acid transferase [Mariprofundus sp.]